MPTRNQIPLKKALGQHILIDNNIRKKILHSCAIRKHNTVLEIGPGFGALTRELACKAKKVLAVEIDTKMYDHLKQTLGTRHNITLVRADILKFPLERYRNIIVVGNIPYYITAPIIIRLLKYRRNIKEVFLMVQKEVAHRILAAPGRKEYGSFSCLVQYYTKPEILFPVSRNCFKPIPAVDSCFLKLTVLKEPAFPVPEESLLLSIIRLAFRHRRKTLVNNLAALIPKARLTEYLRAHFANPAIRPEQLSLQDFCLLAQDYSALKKER